MKINIKILLMFIVLFSCENEEFNNIQKTDPLSIIDKDSYKKGDDYFDQGDYVKSIEYFLMALEESNNEKDSTHVYGNLYISYLSNSQFSNAEKIMRKKYALDSKEKAELFMHADLCFIRASQGRYENAVYHSNEYFKSASESDLFIQNRTIEVEYNTLFSLAKLKRNREFISFSESIDTSNYHMEVEYNNKWIRVDSLTVLLKNPR